MSVRIQDIDLKLLRVFQAVARHQGFSAAQDALNSTQSAISMNMSQLETRLGVRLCERGVKGFRLTEQGKEVLESAEKLFAALDDFRSDTERVKGNITGTLRLGIVDNISFSPEFQAPQAINKLKKDYPELGVDVFVGAPQELEERLLDGRVRAAIGLFHRKLPKINYSRLFYEEHELYCGASHPFFDLSDRAISDEQLMDASYVGRDYLETYQPLKPPMQLKQSASSRYIEGLAALILSGTYIAYLPTHYARIWSSQGKMRSIRPTEFRKKAAINLAYRRSRSMAPELSAFIKIISAL
ncbi:MAG TPA: LysR family transcriptional regulator [Parvularculaceae bacterium]|nr:LysR family transcriptional regulator [Amphiplicatus sp.]HPE32646.1 LysR family transcriptional regulator [Parvularculaceae bacterium]